MGNLVAQFHNVLAFILLVAVSLSAFLGQGVEAVAIPMLQQPLHTFGLTPMDWLIVVAAVLTIFPTLEIAKWFERRGWFGSLD